MGEKIECFSETRRPLECEDIVRPTVVLFKGNKRRDAVVLILNSLSSF